MADIFDFMINKKKLLKARRKSDKKKSGMALRNLDRELGYDDSLILEVSADQENIEMLDSSWSFLKNSKILPPRSFKDLNNHSLIGEPINDDLEYFLPSLHEATLKSVERKADVIHFGDNRNLEILCKVIAYPGDPRVMNSFYEYTVDAVNFLEEKMDGFVPPRDIVIVEKDKNYLEDFDGKIFLTGRYFLSYFASVEDLDSGKRLIDFVSKVGEGGIFINEYCEDDGYICLSCGDLALLSPISEALHMFTSSFIDQYCDKLEQEDPDTYSFYQDKRLFNRLSESFNESVSYLATKEFLEMRGANNLIAHVDRIHNELSLDVYNDVPLAINWIRSKGERGIREAYDIYKHDPGEFGKSIGILELQ